MSESVAGEIARVEAPAALIQESLTEFARVLPAGIRKETFGQWALTMLSKVLASPDQRQREAWERVLSNGAGLTSVAVALKECASLGLQPGSEYHLVPFGATVTGITDYKGEIRLITNAERCSVITQLVHQADSFAMISANIPPRHQPPKGADGEPDWFSDDRGPVVGGYAFADYGGGRFSQVIHMREGEFLRHREKARSKAIWDEWPESMRVKTLVHQLRKFVQWSPEWRQ